MKNLEQTMYAIGTEIYHYRHNSITQEKLTENIRALIAPIYSLLEEQSATTVRLQRELDAQYANNTSPGFAYNTALCAAHIMQGITSRLDCDGKTLSDFDHLEQKDTGCPCAHTAANLAVECVHIYAKSNDTVGRNWEVEVCEPLGQHIAELMLSGIAQLPTNDELRAKICELALSPEGIRIVLGHTKSELKSPAEALDPGAVALSAAYIMRGVLEHLTNKGKDFHVFAAAFGDHGDIETVDRLASLALDCEEIFLELNAKQDPDGVWEYEVCEPLGRHLAELVLESETDFPPRNELRAKIRELARRGPFAAMNTTPAKPIFGVTTTVIVDAHSPDGAELQVRRALQAAGLERMLVAPSTKSVRVPDTDA